MAQVYSVAMMLSKTKTKKMWKEIKVRLRELDMHQNKHKMISGSYVILACENWYY